MKKNLFILTCGLLWLFTLPCNAISREHLFELDRDFEDLRSVYVAPVQGMIEGNTIHLTFCENLWDVTVNITDAAGAVIDTYFLNEVECNDKLQIDLEGNEPGNYSIEVIMESGSMRDDFTVE